MIRAILFNLIFWPLFGLYITIFYPFTFLFFLQRQTFVIVYRKLAYLMLFCLKYIEKVESDIQNLDVLKETLKSGPVIIGCNHQSVWETLIFATIFDELTIVVKKELLNVPVAGLYFRKLGCIPVDRSSPISAIKSLLKFGKIAFKKQQSILIFPNGTRSSADEHVEFKSGIFALYNSLKLPVVPVTVDSGRCWPRHKFQKKSGTIHLVIKPAILPGLSKEEFMKEFEIAQFSH